MRLRLRREVKAQICARNSHSQTVEGFAVRAQMIELYAMRNCYNLHIINMLGFLMSPNLRPSVAKAQSPSPWDLGNEVLYELCRKHPSHTEVPAVIAKVWLIGRSYAAAIERRREKDDENDDFYVQTVAPALLRSDIDMWIENAARHKKPNATSLEAILATHANVTELFNQISGLEKRSLASKYLHFHAPNLFYIYDTRAVEAMRTLSSVVGRAGKGSTLADNEYRKFAEKCLRLQEHINEEFNVLLTPRELDKLLLEIHATET